MKKYWTKIKLAVVKWIGSISWSPKTKDILTQADQDFIKSLCIKDYYIIATRRDNYLSTFFICLGHFLLTGRWGQYSHVMMNLEDEVKAESDFRFIEAVGTGTRYSTFDVAFADVTSVAMIKPKHMELKEWTACLDAAKVHLGKPYDNLFDIKSDLEINCVELIRLALQSLPDYSTRFHNFENVLSKKKILTPQMFLECEDFHVICYINT